MAALPTCSKMARQVLFNPAESFRSDVNTAPVSVDTDTLGLTAGVLSLLQMTVENRTNAARMAHETRL